MITAPHTYLYWPAVRAAARSLHYGSVGPSDRGMFKGFDNIALNDFFKLSSTTLRGHTLKIYKPQVNLDVRKFFFTGL